MTGGPYLSSPVVSTQWLADHLGADHLVVVDATVLEASGPFGGHVTGDETYLLEGHIPGAVFADLIERFSEADAPLPFTRPSAERFAAAVGALGIDNDTTVVVYDAVMSQWAARLWWLFRAAGYDRVAVLDGGSGRWRAEGRRIDVGHVEPVPRSFVVRERPELWVDKAFVERVVSGLEDAALVCGVPSSEFSAPVVSRPRPGHIPGSISVSAARLIDRETGEYRDDDRLRAAFAPALDGRRIVVYCAGGIASASDALALTLIGETDVALYDGSLNEWSRDPHAALVATP